MRAMAIRDRVRKGEFVMDDQSFPTNTLEGREFRVRYINDVVIPTVNESVGVDVTNVVEYLRQLKFSLDIRSMDAMRSPWPNCWLEAKLSQEQQHVPRVAVHVSSISAKEWWGGYSSLLAGKAPSGFAPQEDDDDVLLCTTWTWLRGFNAACGPEAISYIAISKEGGVQTGSHGGPMIATGVLDTSGDDDYKEMIGNSSWAIPLFTFQFANCRNVEIEEILPTRQERRLRERQGEPVDTHYVLRIDNRTQRRVYGAAADNLPPSKRLHICRGHFSTYTEERPLFGKYSGRFWIPAHTRGSSQEGVTRKEYKVVMEDQP